MSQVARALEALDTPVELEPAAIRARVCDALASLDQAATTLHFRLVITRSGPRVYGMTVRGSEQMAEACRGFVRSFENVQQEMSAVSGTYEPALVRPIETRAFVEFHRVVPDHVLQETSFYEGFLRPAAIIDQQRMLVFHGRQMMGWVGFMRHRGEPRFIRADRVRMAKLVRPVQRLLTAAGRLDRTSRPDEPGDLVVRADGTVEHASRGGRAWLNLPSFRDALDAHVRQLEAAGVEERVDALPPEADARIVRVEGSGATRYVVNVRPCVALERPRSSLMTPAEREVAQLAAAGATAREIARMLDKSVETVRNQIRHVYRKLAVTNRVELVHELRD